VIHDVKERGLQVPGRLAVWVLVESTHNRRMTGEV
jgi:hypothetical protein